MFFLFTIVLSDYLSLLFVRRFLNVAITHPIRASITSSIVGVVVVIVSYCVIFTLFLAVSFWFSSYGDVLIKLPPTQTYEVLGALGSSMYIATAAFIIHLWLPLFALSSLAVRLMFPMFRAVEKAQWFLKQGDAHPLKAIGIVATIIVFGSAMLVKEAWTVL